MTEEVRLMLVAPPDADGHFRTRILRQTAQPLFTTATHAKTH